MVPVGGKEKAPEFNRGLFRSKKKILGSFEVHGRHTTSAIRRQFELNFLAFVQALHAGFFDSRDMNEYIASTFIGNDEAEAFFVVEPFYGTARHTSLSLSQVVVQQPGLPGV